MVSPPRRYTSTPSQLTSSSLRFRKVTVVIGRGKSGWNKLLGKSTGSSASSTRTRPDDREAAQRLADATNLHKLEPVNDEQKYVAACERLRAERRNKGKARANAEAVAKAPASSTSLDFEESGVIVTDKEREEVKPATKVEQAQVATVREEEEEEEHEPTHDMFAGAGKFLLAGGLAGAGAFPRSRPHISRSPDPSLAVSRTATAPFDRLKVYLITSPASAPPKPDPAAQLAKSGKPPRPGAGTLVNAIRTVYAQGGGIKAFWTGNGLNIIKIFPVRCGTDPNRRIQADLALLAGIGHQVPLVRVGEAHLCAVLGQGARPDAHLELEPIRRGRNRRRHQPVL